MVAWLILLASVMSAAADEAMLRAHRIGTDDASLLAVLAQFRATPEDKRTITDLIRKLGGGSFRERERSALALLKQGGRALPALRQALSSSEVEAVQRAKGLIEQIEKRSQSDVVLAALHLLVRRQPAGTAQALWDYLGGEGEEAVREAATLGLGRLAQANPKLCELLRTGLEDAAPGRRATAALLLGKLGGPGDRQFIRRLLTDDNLEVRLKAARGLLAGRDVAALPALARLIDGGPLDGAIQAHALLRIAAGEQSPKVPLGSEASHRQRCALAWSDWVQAPDSLVRWKELERAWLESSPAARAHQVALLFADALLRNDNATINRLIELPFHLGATAPIRTREEFNQIIEVASREMQKRKPTIMVIEMLSAAAYAQRLADNDRTAVLKLPVQRLQVALVRTRYGDGNFELGALLIEVRGGSARVVGVLDGRAAATAKTNMPLGW